MGVLVARGAEDALIAEALLRAKMRSTTVGVDEGEGDRCRCDVVYWVCNYITTYDPRPEASPNHLPFALYPFQQEHVNWLEQCYKEGKDSFTEKSRDMGVSWLTLAWLLHHWLYDESFQGLVGSRKEDLVDNWQMDSMFGKLGYMVERLPKWMMPRDFELKKHRQYMKLVNPQSGNALLGESANPNFSRQGRYGVIVLDELGFWPWARAVWTGTADASPCRVVITTAEPGSFAKELRNSGKIVVRTLHWKLHPKKTDEWYEQEKERRTDEDIAKELDINWSGSVRGLVYPGWGDIRKGEYGYQEGWPLYVSWDFGIADDTALVWWQRNPVTKLWRIVDCVSANGHSIDWFVPFVTGVLPSGGGFEYSQDEVEKVRSHENWGSAIHFGDPAGEQRDVATGESAASRLRNQHAIYIQSRPGANTFEKRYTATTLFLRKIEGINIPACSALDDAMGSARFPERREGSQATGEINKPIHDWSCLAGETQIRTLQGWRSIKDLVDSNNFWVWSYSQEEQRLVPAKASRAWKSGVRVPLLEVGLDDGHSIRCTPEHRFMRRDGGWVEAQDLGKGMSLMPFYEFNNRTYVRVRLNDGSTADEHVYVFTRVNGMPPARCHIDHIDGDRSNNDPSNLQALTIAEHCRKTLAETYFDKPKQSAMAANRTRGRAMETKPCRWCGEDYTGSYKSLYCSLRCKRQSDQATITVVRQSKWTEKICDVCGVMFVGSVRRKTCSDACHIEHNHRLTQRYNKEQWEREKAAKGVGIQNHTVLYVKPCENADVYDIEVPGYHNFVAEGVVVHNSHYRTCVEYQAVNLPARDEDKPKVKRRLMGFQRQREHSRWGR